MNKKLLSLAVASALSAPALAQTTEVYGLIDSGYGQVKSNYAGTGYTQSVVGGINSGNGSGTLSGSRLGFRGQEDLGGGTRASFVLENGISLTNSTSITAAAADNVAATNGSMLGSIRQAEVKVSNAASWGSVRIGTFNSQVKDVGEAFAADGGYTLTGGISVYQLARSTLRPSNAIEYQLPELMKGLDVRYAVYKDGAVQSSTYQAANNGNSLSAVYTASDWSVGAVYENYANFYASASTPLIAVNGSSVTTLFNGSTARTYDSYTSSLIGGKYTLEGATLFAQWNKVEANLNSVPAAEGNRVSR
ncbi:MAG: porin, partial [Proteobacteria bacterium]|nr:porin [Pseudomonadota bacterium]